MSPQPIPDTPEVRAATQYALRYCQRRLRGRHDAEEVASVALVGIARAIASYRPEHGTKLATWASERAWSEVGDWLRRGGVSGWGSRHMVAQQKLRGVRVSELPPLSVEDHFGPTWEQWALVDTASVEAAVGQRLNADLLHRALVVLRPRQLQVVHRYFWDGLTYREIALEMQISESRVQQLRSDALARLRQAVGSLLNAQ